MIAASFLPKTQTIADIGCDHGKFSVYCLQNKIAKKIIATDISDLCLQKTKKLAESFGLENDIETRTGSGLEPIEKNEVKSAAICGMGGPLICEIFANNIQKTKTIDSFVLQPMSQVSKLRKFLRNNDFCIKQEAHIQIGEKNYQILLVKNGRCEYSKQLSPEAFDEVGPILFENKNQVAFKIIQSKLEMFENQLQNLKTNTMYSQNQAKISKKIEMLKTIISAWR